MKVVGIIAEYNPFHNGHKYHLNCSRELTGADYVVSVMSGNFTQRGEPALWDKWTRAEMAVKNGVDLVLELPFVFACNNAELFARGAMEILDRLGCVTDLVFGSECGDLSALEEIAELLADEPVAFGERLRINLEQGKSFPAARAVTVSSFLGEESAKILSNPNNILAIEYLKQAKRLGSNIVFHTVLRKGEGYHSENWKDSMASASSIRCRVRESGYLPDIEAAVPLQSMDVLKRFNQSVYEKLNQMDMLLRYKICTSETEWLKELYSVTEGLENKLKKAVTCGVGLSQLIAQLKSKRYTHTRICRILCHILVGLSRRDMLTIQERGIVYGRVLGFNKKGAELLKYIKKEGCTSMPIITNLKKKQIDEMGFGMTMKYDVLASDIWNMMVYGEIYNHSDFVAMPFSAEPRKKD